MSMKDAKASNWVAERADTTATSFDLKGTTKSYTTFSKSFSAGQTVFYSAHDEDGNRESGYGEFDGSTVITRNPTATLVNGIYDGNAPSKVDFTGEVTVACTFNASAFNTLWAALDAIDPDGDGSINIPPELINGLIDSLNSKAEQVDLEKEIQDRIDGDQALQDQIDALDPDGDRTVDWSEIDGKPAEFPPAAHDHDGVYAPVVHGHEIDEINGLQDALDASGGSAEWNAITGKPAEFPPESHGHEIADVNGLQDALDSAGGTPAWDDVTSKPTEFPPAAHNQDWSTITNTPSEYPPEAHTHEQGDIDGLELRLDAIEGSITDGGGFVDAPDDGKLYGRQSEAWAEVVIPDGGASSWDEIADKPTEFPPAAHDQGWDTITDKPDDFPPSTHGHAWGEITGKPTEFPPEDHTHVVADITDFDPADYQPKGDYQPAGDYVTEAPDDGKQYVRESEAWAEIVIPEGGTGSSVHIGETAPADPQEGQQWMEVPASGDATMWIYDGGKWLQQPGGKDGADGQAGADGNIADATTEGVVATWDDTAKQWTPDSSLTIDASGDATFSNELAVQGAKINFSNDWQIRDADGSFVIRNTTNSISPLTIDATGNAEFTGSINSKNLVYINPTDQGDDSGFIRIRGGTGSWFNIGKNQTTNSLEINSGASFESPANGGLSIGSTGDATFSGNITSTANGADCILTPQYGNEAGAAGLLLSRPAQKANVFLMCQNGGSPVFSVGPTGNTRAGGQQLLGTRDLIETLSTLRNATKDEETLEGLRDAIGNAVGGLIEKFEAMQSTATQEISDE